MGDDLDAAPVLTQDSDTVSLRFRLTEEEHYRAAQAMATRSVHSNLFWALLFVLPIGSGLVVDLVTGERVTLGLPVKLPMWWFGIVVALVLVSVAFLVMRSLQHRAFRTSPFAKGDLSYVLNESRVGIESVGSTSSVSWGALHRVVETAEFFLLYTSSTVALVIPKRALPAGADSLLTRAVAEHGGHAG